jgi:hypothetical protein
MITSTKTRNTQYKHNDMASTQSKMYDLKLKKRLTI